MIELDLVSGGSVAIVRRSALAAAGTFNKSLRFREDWDMWIRLARCVRSSPCRALWSATREVREVRRAIMSRWLLKVLTFSRRFGRIDAAALSQERLRFCTARDLFAIACSCAIRFE